MDHMSGCIKNSKTISRRREHKMSIVIIGGHDRMVRQYETICKKHNCKAKIFTQMPSCLNKKIGTPDLVVLFTQFHTKWYVVLSVKQRIKILK